MPPFFDGKMEATPDEPEALRDILPWVLVKCGIDADAGLPCPARPIRAMPQPRRFSDRAAIAIARSGG